ncbi:histidine kinase [Geoanaerobacter pelophilus]|uniref:Histidine kinase n=1 Tax=Geoanaerobacter pelophilus TaxID=60036 RepID=A0ABQ0MEC3_9BACT|nr:PAS domain S-box protein [Geoanaerobacter pelophilus]GAW65452.1 histidine kinase [Geoanaerobacter pelophilus]
MPKRATPPAKAGPNRSIPDPNLLLSIVGSLSNGIYVIQDGRAIFLNDRFAEIFGYPDVAPLIGEKMYDKVYPDRQSVELFRSVNEKVMAGGSQNTSWGQPCKRADGTVFWLEVEARRIEVKGRPAVLGTFLDHTDCKLLGQAMHASQATLHMLLDAMEDRVYVVTDQFHIVYANRKMQEGMTGDITNELCYRVCRGLSERCSDCSSDEVFATGKPVYKEFFNERTQRWYSVIELAVRMPGIERPTKLAVARDITVRKEAEEKVRALSHRLFSAQENERKHLSRELHDDLGQRLNAVKIGVDTLACDLPQLPSDVLSRVGYLSEILQSTIQSVRNICSGLRPSSLERRGLVQAITSDCAELASVHGLKIDVKSSGMKKVRLDHEAEINLYRVFQESLHNVVKHAQASRVSVSLIASHPIVRMRIEDDGKGFVPAAGRQGGARQRGLGLVSIAERVDLMRGSFDLVSRPQVGTRIVVEIPCSGYGIQ